MQSIWLDVSASETSTVGLLGPSRATALLVRPTLLAPFSGPMWDLAVPVPPCGFAKGDHPPLRAALPGAELDLATFMFTGVDLPRDGTPRGRDDPAPGECPRPTA